jgi:hypothetical protein
VRRVGSERLGESEVEDLGGAVRRDLEVRGLEIAMDDALALGGLEPLGDLEKERERLGDRKSAAGDAIGERLAFDQLHRQKADSVVGLGAVERGDVLMVERRQNARLALEAGEPFGVVRDVVGEDLDRDLAAEPGVARAIDLTHAAGAETAGDLEVPQAGA